MPSAKLELQGPALPDLCGHVWEWFCALSVGRSGSGFGLGPITWPDLEAWARLHRIRLRPHELAWLRALDVAFLAAQAKESPDAGAEDRGAA